MGILGKLFSPSRGKISCSTLAKEIFWLFQLDMEHFQELVDKYLSSWDIKRSNIYICYASVFYAFCFGRVRESNPAIIQPEKAQEISNQLMSLMTNDFLTSYPDADPDNFIEGGAILIEKCTKAWNNNLNSELGPYWYLAKEFLNNLEGSDDAPDPNFIVIVSEVFSSFTLAIAEFIIDVQKKYIIK